MRLQYGKAALAVVATVGLGMLAPSSARAATIQLGFILDESGSIGSGPYGIIKNGLASAIQNLIPIGGIDDYEVSVVSFSNGAQTLVDRQLISSAADATAVAAAITADAFTGGGTDYAAAFNEMQQVLTSNGAFTPGLAYVNFATDGAPNSQAAAITARDALVAAGVDNISIEGIGINASGAAFLQNSICYPGPCDTTAPYNFPTQGFYVGVADAQGYADAIGAKLQVVTEQPTDTPEPATMALLGVGLLGLGMARRRRS